MPVHPVLGECVDRCLEDREAGGWKEKGDDERLGRGGTFDATDELSFPLNPIRPVYLLETARTGC